MKIRENKNNLVGSFEFSCDISKNDFIKKILDLFELKKFYLLISGLESIYIDKLKNFSKKTQIENYTSRESTNMWNFALELTIDQFSSFLKAIDGTEYDEIEIWNCMADWKFFIDRQSEEPKFLTFPKSSKNELSTLFLLNYSRYKDHSVLIVYNPYRWNEITKKDIEQIFYH